MRRVAITGFGVVSPVGVGRTAFWDSLEAGRSGIGRIDAACVVTANLLSFACQDFIELRPISLDQLLDDALEVMSDRFSSAGVSVVRDFRDLPPVEIDPSRMERVFLNLLANAVEAMSDTGGRLTVELFPDRDWAVVRVSDTGHGIRADLLPHVFEPFVTTKGVLAGGDTSALGLGLSVCQGIVRMHGGSITLESPPGQGVVATVFLPLKPVPKGEGAHP